MACFISSFANLQIAHIPGPQIFLADLTTRLFFQFERRVNSKDEMSQLFSKLVPLPPKELAYKKLDARAISLFLLENKRREKVYVVSRETRPGASRGQLKKFYPKYFKDILNLVCNFGFFGKALKLKMNII